MSQGPRGAADGSEGALERVVVFDTALRDGEQSAGVGFSACDKVEIAEALAAMRVDVIDAGFPAASPGEFAAVREVARVVRGAAICGLARAVDARARRRVEDVELSPIDATRADPELVVEIVRAALRAGARQVELCVNGIGERAGNTPFEEVVMAIAAHGRALRVRTGVDTRGIYRVSRLVEERSGLVVPPNKAVVGRNAFRHASGVHQDGVLKHRETYESIDPAAIGHPVGTEIVLGKLSGRAGFAAKARELGFALEGDRLQRAFASFQALADRRRELADDELKAICAAA